ncbi:uncharacterized protein FRV6_12737 [Fusarium oxysporum]|uniref:Uncharacterized protein n=1 Tax=Fusarium oxysporum TaxID=5507 RepID=A0A2H3TUW5_FUSOX|nr:uncharacterized protein FRV6_12737 [Fusarium oxysporum]
MVSSEKTNEHDDSLEFGNLRFRPDYSYKYFHISQTRSHQGKHSITHATSKKD